MSEKRCQPKWIPPETRGQLKLELFNSLTREKVEFKSIENRKISWYNCGPTVYDSSHMGHARSYITFDIIRRILRDYFGFKIFFVQNITDIDDKIIRRARQNYLFDQYLKEIDSGKNDRQKVFADFHSSLNELQSKFDNESDPDKKSMLIKLINQSKKSIDDNSEGKDLKEIAKELKDPLSIWLDQHYGHEVCDREIFISLPRYYENEFNNDMRLLNILAPDCVTRVSEYVPEIVDYIKKIIDNGYGYVSNSGSVYFDTEKFSNSSKHFYAKLVPEAYGDSKALAEGEGDLLNQSDEEKRNANDFALWKNSKPGEPWWPSPWGNGRPGWHIECSVMASSIIGEQMDIHSGGIDLRFPHHDNEMAQSESYFDTGKPWVNYFLHSGHLTISGCKMSKSLKNFITIKDALKKNTSRQLRIAFLLHSWKDTLDYSDNTMNDAIHFEKTLNEFFLTVKDIIRQNNRLDLGKRIIKWDDDEKNLHNKFMEHVERIDIALHDNIDTKRSCEEIRRLISISNIYIQNKQNQSNTILLFTIASYITKLMDIFGCINSSGLDGQRTIGFPKDSTTIINQNGDDGGGGGDNDLDKEEIIMPFIESMAKLRDKIRNIAKELKQKELYDLGDYIRDDLFPELGVRMEDYETNDGKQQWRLKLVDPKILLEEKRKRIEELATLKKLLEEHQKRKQQQQQKTEEVPPVNPKEMFLMEKDKYSKFDSNGLPTHDQDGKEITKTAQKKLMKRYEAQEKKYQSYLARKQQQQN